MNEAQGQAGAAKLRNSGITMMDSVEGTTVGRAESIACSRHRSRQARTRPGEVTARHFGSFAAPACPCASFIGRR